MKKRDLEKKLKSYNWYFARHGGNHDIWTNGVQEEPVPRHREINEIVARKILKKASNFSSPHKKQIIKKAQQGKKKTIKSKGSKKK